ncbi:hypothetical protein [Rhizobium halophytocola]|uniref:Uncharacterized protein n=1 Tax=Rhizobium halophytocola TaxID=735519 RepID=A0ABS4DZ56_9HYPH|nr:hypothetical protein [Rhizobium halophytocola]MBP1850968.1 hypothetical protein [Rhizobium halophytocola]
MAKTVRILSVQSVELSLEKSDPARLVVIAMGIASTPGYTNVRLDSLEEELSSDGIFDLEFVGDPPDGIVIPKLTPVAASIVLDRDVDRIVGVLVHARTNQLLQLLSRDPLTEKTLALGEEMLTTFALGEENPTTLAFGEETPSTRAIGEEDPSTRALGEEDPTTLALGEEGGGSTAAVGEEFPKTLALAEEGPKTLALAEEGPKGIVGESGPVALEKLPGIENKTLGSEIFDPQSPLVLRGPFGVR